MISKLLNHSPILRYTHFCTFNRLKYTSANITKQDGQSEVKEKPQITMPEVINASEKKYSVGNDYENFKCIRAESIPEFNITSYTFSHNKSGSVLWYLNRNDPNNVFSVNFRTTPFDSTGLPHILEHIALCGSEKYPVRDPFFKMLTRSVATFMNAMTGPDYTIYPFSSMNEVDYRNLQKIYLDAVFRPNLKYLDFLQEGWRLEHSSLKDKNSDYLIKGVVYNEMKGAFSENSSIFAQNLLNNLLPDHTYGHVSGGNPLEIPKLSHADLVAFHKKYYHPSNSRIYCYGSFDINKTLQYINEKYFSKYDLIDNSYSCIPNQKRWTKSRNVHISSRFDNLGAPFEKQNQISIALLMSDVTNISETFDLYVLSELLVRGPNSPFYKTLIEPNFSGGYNQTTGYDPQVRDTYFSVGLLDLKVEDFGRVQEIFDTTLRDITANGFDEGHVESVLHNIELSLKHQNPQFGLGLLFNTTPLWNHDGDVVEYLRVSSLITAFRAKLKQNPKYLQEKLEKYFVSNEHRLTLTMSPDDHYEANFKQAEQILIKNKVANLKPEDAKKIYKDGLALEESQKAVPNIGVLPCLALADVKTPPKITPLQVVTVQGVPTQVCTVQTNGITYLKCFFDSVQLTPEEIVLIPFFCNVIDDMGTENYDYRVFDKTVTSKTSGFELKLNFAENIHNSKTYDLGVLLTTHALNYNTKSMFDLVHELLCKFTLNDTYRLQMLIENYISSISVGITNAGHLYAMQTCSGLVTDAAKLKSQLTGVEHIELMKEFFKTYTAEDVKEKLSMLGGKLFNRKSMRVAINTPEEFLPKLMPDYENFLQKLPAVDISKKVNAVNMLEPSRVHYVMNIPVNYCAKSLFTVPYIHEDHPPLRILAKLISSKYLLPTVREQNGAYGSGAKLGSDGIFSFYSYRDPNSIKTLDVFENTYDWLKKNESNITEQTLFEAKLGVLQQLDAPIAPGNHGVDYFLYGVSQQLFQQYRQRMLDVSLNQLKAVVDKYFKDKPRYYGQCILGPENRELKKSKEKWITIA